jgi:dTDP-4-dehydrorhamnose reductase
LNASPPVSTLLTGAGGQLGRELRAATPEGWALLPYTSAMLDVTSAEAVEAILTAVRPQVVIHAAAYTAVDAAENDPERARLVNTRGAANVAEAARRIDARMVHISTDYVFGGTQGRAYLPDDAPAPLSVYGRSKLDGEREVVRCRPEAVILRSAWLYSSHGSNFVLQMLERMRAGQALRVVSDQVGSPTWARSLADAVWRAAARPEVHGVHHWTDAGVATWYDFAVAVQEEAMTLNLLTNGVSIMPVTSDDYRTAARRPGFSVLDKRATWAALDLPVHHWRVNLRRMLQELAGA